MLDDVTFIPNPESGDTNDNMRKAMIGNESLRTGSYLKAEEQKHSSGSKTNSFEIVDAVSQSIGSSAASK